MTARRVFNVLSWLALAGAVVIGAAMGIESV